MIKIVSMEDILKADNLTVIIPSKYEIYYKRKLLNKSFNLLTLKNFLLNSYDGNKHLVTKEENYIIMYDALKNVSDKLTLYKNDLSIVNDLISTYKDFKMLSLNDSDKIKDLSLIYEAYEKRLDDHLLINEWLLYFYVLEKASFNNSYLVLNVCDMDDVIYPLIKKMNEEGEVSLFLGGENKNTIDELKKFGLEIKENIEDVMKKEINYKVLNDVSDEVEFISNDVSKRIMDGASYNDFLIVTNALEDYYPYFDTLFNHPFSKKEVTGTLTNRFVKLFCMILEGDFSSKNFISLLKLGLINESSIMVDKFDNYVYSWNLEDEDFYKAFTHNPNGDKNKLSEIDKSDLERLNEAKDNVITPIKYLLENLVEERSTTEILKNIYTYLSEEGIIEKLFYEDYEGALKLTNTLDYINDYLGEETALSDVLNILKNVSFETSKITLMNDTVTISSLKDAPFFNKKYVYIIGAQNDLIPMRFNIKGLLDEYDVLEESLTNLLEKHEKDEHFYFYRLIQSDSVTITNHKLGLDLKLKLPSSYLNDLNLKKITYDKLYDKHLIRMDYALKLSDDRMMPYDDETFNKIIESNKNDLNYTILENTAFKLYGNDIFLSPSQIETYAKCPFAHFCEKGLKLKIKEKYVFDNRKIGTFVHFILEKIIRNDFDKVNEKNILDFVIKYEDEYLSENEITDETVKYVIKKLGFNAVLIIKNILKETDVSLFKPKYFEFKIDDNNIIKPIVINFDDKKLTISGIADRIDVYEDEDKYYYRIIDYKTRDKKFRLDDILMGLNLQMLLYLLAIKENKDNITKKKLAPSAILYYPAGVKECTSSRGISIEEKSKLIDDRLKMNGLVNRDKDVLNALGEEQIGDFISVTTRGKLNEEYLFDNESLDLIFGKAKSVIKNFASQITKGQIYANPIGGRIDSCAYCKYASVCKFDEKVSKKRKPMNFKNSEVLMMLEGDSDA